MPHRSLFPAGPLARVLALLAAVLLALPALADTTGPVPPRRVVAETGVDYYGGDLRAIYGTTLPLCRTLCLEESACGAFTFNRKASACFLKSGAARRDPFAAAVSGVLMPADPAALAEAAARGRDLRFLDPAVMAAAAAEAVAGIEHPANGRDAGALAAAVTAALAAGDLPGALEAQRARVSLTDAAADWLGVAAMAARIEPEDYLAREAMRQLSLAAAANAYLRGTDAAERAAAAQALAALLERVGQGRQALDAARLAAGLAPGEAVAAAVERLRGLYGFRLLESAVEPEAVSPRACFRFSEPLAAAGVSWGDYVQVEGGTYPVEATDGQLCVEGLSHGTRYRVTLRAGLPSAAGETLRAPVAQELYVRDRAPAVRFPGRAYVLPRGPGASVPVSTVNTGAVDLRLYRVGPRNLTAVLRGEAFGQALDSYAEDRLKGDLGEAVWQGTGEVGQELNRDVVTALPLGEAVAGREPGLYALTARVPGAADDGGAVATQWFVISDLGLATLGGADGLHVFVRALGSAAPVAGADLVLLARNNEVLGQAVSDADGHAVFAPGLLRGQGGAEPALVTAALAGDFVFLDLGAPGFDLSDRGVEGRAAPPPVDVFIATERGAYRPGETVHATVLARDSAVRALAGLPLTAVVRRPDGVEQSRQVLADAGAGGRVLAMPLDADAMRGGWRLAIHADPEAAPLASAGFLVEDFVPERVRLGLSLPEAPVDPAAGVVLGVQADYLYGAPGAGLGIEGEVTVALARGLPGYPGYVFGREDETGGGGYAGLPAGLSTDAAGAARLMLDLPEAGPVSRPLEMTATVRVRDGAGRPVERRLVRPVLPAAPLVGVRPLFDGAVDEGGTAAFELVAVGPDLARLALGPLDWRLSRIETTYVWYRTDGDWRYEPVTRRAQVAAGSLSLGLESPGRLDLPVGWGRYELEVSASDGRYIATSLGFAAGWAPAGAAGETPDLLAVSLDRAEYRPGDTARLQVSARSGGELMVAVMTDRLVATQTLHVEAAGERVVDLPVTADWAPGAYVTATLIRPMDVPARRNPARAIGLAWARIAPGERVLTAAFETPAETAPRRTLPAVLKIEGLAAGETAYATIAAVDEGILNLTGFAAPDPEAHYFGQRRLGMEMRDLYGRLIDGMQGTPGRVRSGGDASAGFRAPPPTEKLVAVFSGVLTADATGRVQADIPLPAFNGTVKLMAVVWSRSAVGQAEAALLVRDPVVVQASLPRFLRPGDSARLRLDLAHATGPAGAVSVAAVAEPPGLLPGGAWQGSADLGLGERAVLTVPLAAGDEGDDALRLTTRTAAGETLVTELTLPVRTGEPALARQSRITLAPGAALTLDAASFAGLVPGSAVVTLAAGPLAQFDVPGLLSLLDGYPYGCTEQLVSKALPLVYFGAVARAMGGPEAEDLDARIAAGIRGVLGHQGGSGGFGAWGPGGGEGWLDAYATDFLARARAAGHAVPDRAFEAALVNLSNQVAAYGDFEAGGEDLAYALMVLAREGRAAIGDLRYYADAKAEDFATPLALAQLGQALAWYGDQPRADRLFRAASAAAAAGEAETLWRADYGSGLRDAAGVLGLAVAAGSQAADRAALAAIVTAPGAERSTQEALWTLLAANALAGSGGGVELEGLPAGGPPVARFTAADLAAPRVLVNRGAAPVDLVLSVLGVPVEPEPAQGNGYRIERAYYTPEGARADPGQVAQNTRLVAVLTVRPERELQARLMVADPLPAGFEIENPHLLASGETGPLGWLDADDVASHTEFRADRFLAAVDWQGAEPFRLAYMVRAVHPGAFAHPAASVEDMYRPAYRARSAAGRVVVSPAP